MLLIHFMEETETESVPCCHHPQHGDWIWSAVPSDVTCPGCVACWSEVARDRAEPLAGQLTLPAREVLTFKAPGD